MRARNIFHIYIQIEIQAPVQQSKFTSHAFSVAGGGDTLAAIDKYGVADDISYISTGGGAFLEFVEGKKLPAVAILEERAAEQG